MGRRHVAAVVLFLVLPWFDGPCCAQATSDHPADDAATAPVTSAADAGPAEWSDADLRGVLQQLGLPDFTARQAAVTVLTTVPGSRIAPLTAAAEQEGSAEALRRVYEVLERFYVSQDRDRADAAGEILEDSVASDRWIVSELAGSILERNWRIRVTRALQELRTLGAEIKPADIDSLWRRTYDSPVGVFGPAFRDDQLRINIGRTWQGQERGMEVLCRLSPLVDDDARMREVRVGIYLIDGHPLPANDVRTLHSVFGDRRVVSRGVVCLGITPDLIHADAPGCSVGTVAPGTSASEAGLQQSDVIQALNGTEVRDFDHLVELLRQFQVGDKVTMSVLRYGGGFPQQSIPGLRGGPQKLEVPVTLKDWNNLD